MVDLIDKKVDYACSELELTQTEKEVLYLLTKEFLTQKQIAIRRHCSKQAVSKTIRKLKAKCKIDLVNQERGGSSQPVNHQVNQMRLHGEQFIIRILYRGEKYLKIRNECSQVEIDGNTIKLWENKIEIYANKSFYGEGIQDTFALSSAYWSTQFTKIENNLKIIILKQGSQNIKVCKFHLAETNNEVAKEIDNTGDRYLQVRTDEGGKVWLLIDNSFNLHELETVKVGTAKQDMEAVKANFNDWRTKDHYLPSDTKYMIDGIVKASANITTAATEISTRTNQVLELLSIQTQSTSSLAQNIESHIPSWMSNIKVEQELKKLRRQITIRQKRISDFV
jgi:hypothetical protein